VIRYATLEDVERINAWVKRDSGQEVDFSEFLANGMNVCLLEGEGGALFAWRGPGIYEAHAFFAQRGRAVLDLSHRMLAEMRQRGARLFWSAVPVENRKAVLYCRLLGWKSHGVENLPNGRCEIFVGE